MKKKTTDQSSGKILDNPGRSRALRYTPQRWLGCRRHAEQRERSIRQSHRRNTGCAIDETQDAEIKAELEKSRSLVIQSKKAYLKAANRLRHIF